MSIETVCCENMSITCFASCFEMWNVIWEMRFRFVLCRNCLKWFILVIMLDHLFVSFFWSSNLTFDEWRVLILDYRVTYVCSRSVERRLWWDVKLDEASRQTWNETTHQIWRERLIKFDESDSSNLTKENVISFNLTKASSHQTWRKSHLIKLWERRTILLLSDKRFHASTHNMKNLVLQNIIFVRR
jgi:hypothetical protein